MIAARECSLIKSEKFLLAPFRVIRGQNILQLFSNLCLPNASLRCGRGCCSDRGRRISFANLFLLMLRTRFAITSGKDLAAPASFITLSHNSVTP